jgi:hypothetical protein
MSTAVPVFFFRSDDMRTEKYSSLADGLGA